MLCLCLLVDLLSEAGDRVEIALSVTHLSLDLGWAVQGVRPSTAAGGGHAGIFRISKKIFELALTNALPALHIIGHHFVLQATQSHSFFGRDRVRAGVIVVCSVESSDLITAVLIRSVLKKSLFRLALQHLLINFDLPGCRLCFGGGKRRQLLNTDNPKRRRQLSMRWWRPSFLLKAFGCVEDDLENMKMESHLRPTSDKKL